MYRFDAVENGMCWVDLSWEEAGRKPLNSRHYLYDHVISYEREMSSWFPTDTYYVVI